MNPSSYSCKRNIRNVLKIALLSFKFYPFFPFFINLSITFLCVKNTIYSVSSNPYKALITAWNTSAAVGLEQLKIKTHTIENWKESLLQSKIFFIFHAFSYQNWKKKSLRPPCTVNPLARSLGLSILRISNSITHWIKEIKPLIA